MRGLTVADYPNRPTFVVPAFAARWQGSRRRFVFPLSVRTENLRHSRRNDTQRRQSPRHRCPASATGSSWQTGAIVPYIPSAIVLCRPIPHLDTYSKELLLICKPTRRLSRMSARSSSIVSLRMSDIQQPGLPLTSLEIREHRQVFDPAC
jgi:hypothetical protein